MHTHAHGHWGLYEEGKGFARFGSGERERAWAQPGGKGQDRHCSTCHGQTAPGSPGPTHGLHFPPARRGSRVRALFLVNGSMPSNPQATNTCDPRLSAKSLQSCLTLCNPKDRSPPGSSVHDILQARRLEWVALLFSWVSS